MVHRLLRPIIKFPEFTPVLTVGPESERARAGLSDSGPTVSTGHRSPFIIYVKISGPNTKIYNTFTPRNLNDIGIESIFDAYQGKHSRTDYPSGKVTARRVCDRRARGRRGAGGAAEGQRTLRGEGKGIARADSADSADDAAQTCEPEEEEEED